MGLSRREGVDERAGEEIKEKKEKKRKERKLETRWL